MTKLFKATFLSLLLLWAGVAAAQTFIQPAIEKLKIFAKPSDAGPQQDWAVHGDSLYCFYDKFGYIDIINIKNLKAIRKTRTIKTGLTDVGVHCNAVDFSKTFYRHGDFLPLVYVSQRGDSCRTNVYRIVKTGPLYTVELIQTIHFTDATMTTTNVDETGQYLWVYNNSAYGHSYSKVKIPPFDSKDVYISAINDVEKRVRISISGVGQGSTVKGGYIYHLHGYKGQGRLSIVDLSTGKEVQSIDLVSLGFTGEPESIAFHGNDLLIGDHGNIFRLYDAAATAIPIPALTTPHTDGRAYSPSGQPVGTGYKGIVIQDRKKRVKK